MTRYAARVDRNQPEIVAQLRGVPGVTVFPTHCTGNGFPDIVVGYRGASFLYEIKMPGEKLTEKEVKFHEGWMGHVMIAYCVEDILIDLGLAD